MSGSDVTGTIFTPMMRRRAGRLWVGSGSEPGQNLCSFKQDVTFTATEMLLVIKSGQSDPLRSITSSHEHVHLTFNPGSCDRLSPPRCSDDSITFRSGVFNHFYPRDPQMREKQSRDPRL